MPAVQIAPEAPATPAPGATLRPATNPASAANAPAALLARRYVAANHRGMPPPFGPRSFARWMRWAWLLEGAAQYFSGQVRHVRPAVTRRLHESGTPAFPPGRRDAALLGGTVFDLLAREEGDRACVALACGPHRDGPGGALARAFGGRALRHTEAAWRSHLARLGEPGGPHTRG